jgi:ABC-type multidrug transport system fused ATPase/permease subunit
MFSRLRSRKEWQFFSILPIADRGMAVAWWLVLLLRGLLPAGFTIATGVFVGAVQTKHSLAVPLTLLGVAFVVLQMLNPIHVAVSANLGDRTAAWLYDRLTDACVEPPGIGHLEHPELAADLQVARDFDLGMTGPPLSVSMDFIANGLVQMVGGLASAAVLFGYAWWAPILLAGAWLATHYLLKESGVWRDRNTDEVRAAQRDADYAYRLAVDPPGAKELRMFGLASWTLDRFLARRTLLHQLQYRATRMRERSVLLSVIVVGAANFVVFWSLINASLRGSLSLGSTTVYVQAAVGTALIAFGGLNWALDGSSAPVAAVLKLKDAMGPAGALATGTPATGTLATGTLATGTLATGAQATGGRHLRADGTAPEIRFRDVTFAYPTSGDGSPPILHHFDLTIPAGTSLAIVGPNGAGKTTLAKLLCRLYDPQEGAIEIDGVDLRQLDLEEWRAQVTAVFQDFIKFELALRNNVAPGGAPDDVILAALEAAGAAHLAALDTTLSRSYDGGTDLSGGQWQRVALARALCAVRLGAGVVLLDEPTAQLDVRGEAEIFDRILAATRSATTILISHRFSTVRHCDRICVLEDGHIGEMGTHDELMAKRGRYRAMFDLQAQRFAGGAPPEGEEEVVFDVLA